MDRLYQNVIKLSIRKETNYILIGIIIFIILFTATAHAEECKFIKENKRNYETYYPIPKWVREFRELTQQEKDKRDWQIIHEYDNPKEKQ